MKETKTITTCECCGQDDSFSNLDFKTVFGLDLCRSCRQFLTKLSRAISETAPNHKLRVTQ